MSESSEAQPEPRTDLQAFAFLLRRLNGELNHVTHEFARRQGLHPTDAQALAPILDREGPRHQPLTPAAQNPRHNH
ncbi:MarR family transcriptional regulator, partial [Streptomyces sp. NPDC059506]